MARINKIPKSFRLNVEILAILEALAAKHDSDKTDLLEFAIAELAKKEFSKNEIESIVRQSIFDSALPKGS